MRHILLQSVILASLLVRTAAAGDLKVIANPAVPCSGISAEELRSVFLGTRSYLKDSGRVSPVLGTESSHLDMFALRYLGKTGSALTTYYRSLVFTGKWSMPVTFASDDQVVDYVAKTPGAIGFVGETVPADRVKVLRVR